MHDYYEVLGVDEDADEAEIRRAYRRLIAEVHPDRPNGDAEQARLLDEARGVLLDPRMRARYDAQLNRGDALDDAIEAFAEAGQAVIDRGIERIGDAVLMQGQGLLATLRNHLKPRFRAKRRP